jgi:hypothetical protein
MQRKRSPRSPRPRLRLAQARLAQAAAAGLALALSSCASLSPSENSAAPPLAVALPDTCERVLVAVPLPKVAAADDARAAFVRDDAALIAANKRITAGRQCEAELRRSYAPAQPAAAAATAPEKG